ncbi:MAG TPA: hypothetical protein VKD88_10020 [Gaiellaceae bacterium]|nr:hypothetical protein [Gaiellaceae bacterium]
MKQLAKPSVPVWTANQLARREPGEVRALLRTAEELRKAQERALGGKGVSELQERVEEQRRAVRALSRLGRDILAEEGRPASDAIVERIAKTLDAAALDEGARFQLRAGRLTEELDPPGFEALAGLTPLRSRSKRGASVKPKLDPAADARRAVAGAKSEVRARAREAAAAERTAEQAQTAAADARDTAKAARKRSDDAERLLAEAEAALRKARRR